MNTVQKSLRLPKETAYEIEKMAQETGVEKDFKRLEMAYHWLTQQQLRSALGYYFSYKKEIDELIDRNKSWTNESVIGRYPYQYGIIKLTHTINRNRFRFRYRFRFLKVGGCRVSGIPTVSALDS